MVLPVVLGFPAVFLSVPPLMIFIPAAFALGIQVAPAVVGFVAAFAMVMNCLIEPGFSLFDGVLALRPVIGVGKKAGEK
ncbi:MAG: hypothetical protein WCA92_07145 [Terriglobales bacterium]